MAEATKRELERNLKEWRKVAEELIWLRRSNARLEKRLRHVICAWAPPDIQRCKVFADVSGERCQKKADRESMCGPHYRIYWGHDWQFGFSCGLCKAERNQDTNWEHCPVKEQMNGKEEDGRDGSRLSDSKRSNGQHRVGDHGDQGRHAHGG